MGGFLFAPPLPHLLSSARAARPIIFTHVNSCLPEQLLPGKWITDEENSCYLNSLLPSNLVTGKVFSAHAPCLS